MATPSIFQNLDKPDRNTLTFVMSPVSVTYANTLRRAVQTEVSILGFRADMTEDGTTSDVVVYKNSTPMSNEMLADRIGLLPIYMPADVDGWTKERVLFRLAVKNETDEVRIVTASDFECLEKTPTDEDRQRVPNTRFFHPDPVTQETCIIAVLKPMTPGAAPEEIHLEAYATLGKGREHARFNPTSQCSYGYTRDENKDRITNLWETWLREQKKADVKDLEKDTERKAELEREFRSLEIYRCYKVDNGEPYSFDFTMETIGPLSIENAVAKALTAMAVLAEKYASMDRGDLPDGVDIRPADSRMNGYDVWFTGEDHTLGNMLQTWLCDNLVGRTAEEGGIDFAGYKVPHPLRDEMLLRIGVEGTKKFTEAAARLAIAEAAKACADMFRDWAVQWVTFAGAQGVRVVGDVAPKTPWQAHADAKAPRVVRATRPAKR